MRRGKLREAFQPHGQRIPCVEALRRQLLAHATAGAEPGSVRVSAKQGSGRSARKRGVLYLKGASLPGCRNCPGWHNGGARKVRPNGKPENCCTCVYVENPCCVKKGAHEGKDGCVCTVERDPGCDLKVGEGVHMHFRHVGTGFTSTFGCSEHSEAGVFCKLCGETHRMDEALELLDKVLTMHQKKESVEDILCAGGEERPTAEKRDSFPLARLRALRMFHLVLVRGGVASFSASPVVEGGEAAAEFWKLVEFMKR